MAATQRTPSQRRELNELLTRDHTLNGAILVGLDGHVVEMQARTIEVLREPVRETAQSGCRVNFAGCLALISANDGSPGC